MLLFSAMPSDPAMVWSNCPCHRTCETADATCDKVHCCPGYQCKSGYVLMDNVCVERAQCNCEGHMEGDEWQSEESPCTVCQCVDGQQVCHKTCDLVCMEGFELVDSNLVENECCYCKQVSTEFCMYEGAKLWVCCLYLVVVLVLTNNIC